MASSSAAAATGPVPYKEIFNENDIVVPAAPSPKEEFGDLVASLPRKSQFLDGRLYRGFWLPEHYAPAIIAFNRRFTPRPDDVVLVSYPKCGTTWLKALAFAAMSRYSYPLAAGDHPLLRLNPHDVIPFVEDVFTDGLDAKLEMLPSPRLINTHAPYPLLPASITAGEGCNCKVVYICRDPKDMVVSLYHFMRRLQPELSFAGVVDAVADGTVPYGPMWDHILGYWRASLDCPDRVFFLKYEDLLRDAGEQVRALAAFVGRPFTDVEEAAGAVASVVELCSFERMKGLEVNRTGTAGSYKSLPRDSFFRKGVAGDWANHMSPETAARLDGIFRDKFRGTGLAIPAVGVRHMQPAMSAAAGPVPFKDIVVDADADAEARRRPPAAEEYRDIVAALPSKPRFAASSCRLLQYKGTWFREDWVPGFVALHRRFVPRDDGGDVILASLPKCGTTWLKALAFAVAVRGAYPPAGDAHPLLRLNPHDCVPFVEMTYLVTGEEAKLDAAPSPRLMATHVAYSVLPSSITESTRCKIIYICREPKDMLISQWHFRNKSNSNTMQFSDVWESIREENYLGSPIWEHILGYWNVSKAKEVLRDPIKNVEKIANFIGQPFSDAEKEAGIVESIVELCSFTKMKDLSVNNTGFQQVADAKIPNKSYFRKGAMGDWTNYITPEMSESLDKFLSDKFRGSGFSFT
uniref:Sulfotransferase domain-containing protein n=1 Tax=Leersia perrieri TaxID=77586 RepID=A0A0D9X1A5_9ORYZ